MAKIVAGIHDGDQLVDATARLQAEHEFGAADAAREHRDLH